MPTRHQPQGGDSYASNHSASGEVSLRRKAHRDLTLTRYGRDRLGVLDSVTMTVIRGLGKLFSQGSEPATRAAAAYEQARRPDRSGVLGIGTLACARCDAPIATGCEPLLLTDRLRCPFCQNRGPVRDFLSLASPTRPARVVIRVALPAQFP